MCKLSLLQTRFHEHLVELKTGPRESYGEMALMRLCQLHKYSTSTVWHHMAYYMTAYTRLKREENFTTGGTPLLPQSQNVEHEACHCLKLPPHCFHPRNTALQKAAAADHDSPRSTVHLEVDLSNFFTLQAPKGFGC